MATTPRRVQQQQRSQEDLDDSSEQALLAAAMGATETEIFNEAMGDPPEDLDGDRTLEDMGDELGDPEDDDGEPAGDGELDPNLARTGQEGDLDEQEYDEAGNPIEPTERDQFEQPRPARLPSWARPQDQQQDGTLQLLADINTRLTRMERPAQEQRPVDQQRQQEAPTSEEIDPVIDPVGFRAAVRREAQEMVTAAQEQTRLSSSFNNMHSAYEENGRGPEFVYAAGALDRLTKSAATNQGDREIVRSIVNARDPGRALMEWAEEALDLEAHRETVANDAIDQLANVYGLDPEQLRAQITGEQAPRRQNDRQEARRLEQSPPARQQPREQRGAPLQRNQQQRAGGRRLPSLNGASSAGGGRREGGNRNLDMRGMDGSEDAIFQYALS